MNSHLCRPHILPFAAAAALTACASGGTDPPPADALVNEVTDAEAPDAARPSLSTDAAPDASEVPRCSAEGWCSVAVPEGSYFNSVWSDGAGVAWAATAGARPSANTGTLADLLRGAFLPQVLRWDGKAWKVVLEAPRYAKESSVYAYDGTAFGYSRSVVGGAGHVWGSTPTDLWAILGGLLYHGAGPSADSIAWTQVDPPPMVQLDDIVSVSVVGPDDVWAVGGTSVMRLTGSPPAWSQVSLPRNARWTSVTVSDDGDVWIAGNSDTSGNADTSENAVNTLLLQGHAVSGVIQWSQVSPNLSVPFFVKLAVPECMHASSGTLWTAARVDPTLVKGGSVNALIGSQVNPAGSFGPYSFLLGGPASSTGFAGSLYAGNQSVPQWVHDFGRVDGVLYAVGEGYNAVATFDGVAWKPAVISPGPLTNVGPFFSVQGTGVNDIWVVGGRTALHKGGTP